jgi:hypothetical protein
MEVELKPDAQPPVVANTTEAAPEPTPTVPPVQQTEVQPEKKETTETAEPKDPNADVPKPPPDLTPVMTVDTKPEDVRYLTIKNLDTGEAFVIGENDPDFDFDTFEIGAGLNDQAAVPPGVTPQQIKNSRITWWKAFYNYIYGKNSKVKIDEKAQQQVDDPNNPNSQHNAKPRTPFTKLSSFRFRKELGRGAFGRVLLAEAKTDGKLYALKIISKKNMRSSDRRQAKAERDILYCMTLKAPHPFTSGLKFAFQSENHLYLGMDYIPGGNLRELIKRFKYLPEVITRCFQCFVYIPFNFCLLL